MTFCPSCKEEVTEKFNYCPNCAFPLKFQMNPATLSKLFGEIETDRKWIHRRALERLWELGKEYGFWVRLDYGVDNLVIDGRRSLVDVVWISQGRIAVAFEVRIKKRDLEIVTSRKDLRKLQNLKAKEKFVVNVSENTGKAYFHRMDEWKSIDEKPFAQKPGKSYDVQEIKRDHPRAYDKWTPEEEEALAEEYKDGVSIVELAKKHQRQIGAIRSRLRKLGLLEE